MITCKDCIHYFVCEYKPKTNLVNQCADHIDRSRFVELPCKVGDFVYFIQARHVMADIVSKFTIDRRG